MTISLELERLECCPLCQNRDGLDRLVVSRDFETDTGEFPIDVCPVCSLAFTNPRPIEQSIPSLYSQRTTPDFAPGSRGFIQSLRAIAMRHYLGRRLPSIAEQLDILDFGCGDGSLALCAASWGAKRKQTISVTAVDFHDQAPAHVAAATLRVDYKNYWDWRDSSGKYDVILLRHVLEHHPHPVRLLRELGSALKPGGLIHIEVPNRRTFWAKLFGRYYCAYYTPRHFLHFDAESLRRTVANSGLQVMELRKGHTPLIGRSIGQLINRDIDNLGVFGLVLFPLQVGLDIVTGRSTTLRLAARK